jgi:hypothetical protein
VAVKDFQAWVGRIAGHVRDVPYYASISPVVIAVPVYRSALGNNLERRWACRNPVSGVAADPGTLI